MAWNGSDGAAKPQKVAKKSKPSAWRGLLAAIIVIGGAVGAYLMFLGPATVGGAREKVKAKPAKIAEVTPEISDFTYEEEAPEEARDAAEDEAKRARREKLLAMTPGERIEFLFEEAEARPINLEPASNRVYATGTEQVLDWVFTTELGDMPPILPTIPMFEEAHLVEILVNKNKILETDDERAIDGKQTVELAKKELIKFITEGGDVHEFLEYYHDQLRQAHMERQEAQRSVFSLVREEPELAKEYLDAVNARLEEKGIKPVVIPQKMANRFGVDID